MKTVKCVKDKELIVIGSSQGFYIGTMDEKEVSGTPMPYCKITDYKTLKNGLRNTTEANYSGCVLCREGNNSCLPNNISFNDIVESGKSFE